MYFVKATIVVCVCLMFFSCSFYENEEKDLAFIGDSIVARWDVQEYFPSRLVENYGVSGSGIEYIESKRGFFSNQHVVVIIGTNDLKNLHTSEQENLYAQRYVNAIYNLGGYKIFLFSIFPRNFENDEVGMNEKIVRVNSQIKKLIESTPIVYLDVYDVFFKDASIDMQLSYDGLHLSPYGYEILSSKLKDLL